MYVCIIDCYIFFICVLLSGSPTGIFLHARLETNGSSYCWNELITLSTKYRDLTANSQVAFTVSMQFSQFISLFVFFFFSFSILIRDILLNYCYLELINWSLIIKKREWKKKKKKKEEVNMSSQTDMESYSMKWWEVNFLSHQVQKTFLWKMVSHFNLLNYLLR